MKLPHIIKWLYLCRKVENKAPSLRSSEFYMKLVVALLNGTAYGTVLPAHIERQYFYVVTFMDTKSY